MDNTGAVKALGGIIPTEPYKVYGGSNNPEIQTLVLEIFKLTVEHNLHLRVLWVPRQLNQVADYLSKVQSIDHYGFQLSRQTFAFLESVFGEYSIDRFASQNNVMVHSGRFNSRYYEPNSEWVNSFSTDWHYDSVGNLENNWVHPPYSLIGKAINHICTSAATATLVFPFWTSASWWPMMVPLFSSHQVVHLGPSDRILHFPAGSMILSALHIFLA